MAKKRKSKSRQSKQIRRAPRAVTPKTYPSPAERERIIARREKLLQLLIPILMKPGDPRSPNRDITKLVHKYGLEEVRLVLDKFQQSAASRDLIAEEAMLYRLYRQAFARFGGNRPFLKKQDYEALVFEHGKMAASRQFRARLPFLGKASAREKELYDLLLIGADYWEDITPPAPPPRPDDFDGPPAGVYDEPARTLLEWGWAENEKRLATNAKNRNKWQPASPQLVQMTFDEGLFQGWPGEAASWAPYHALHLLGRLQAHEYAGTLLALLEQENDWLSDRLPLVWSRMGPPAGLPLWAYLEERSHDPQKRAIALKGLGRIAEAHPRRWPEIVMGMADLLRRGPVDDATANGYIVYMLDRMEAIEAREAILDAFEQDKVDPKIMQPYDVDFLNGR